tara:strand:+ start:8316 stop:10907 length:2592 start_codon:yes stop_codon:yes gene_type:complete
MITDQATRNVNTQTAPLDAADYHIDQENTTHLTQVLRNMYSQPPLAVVREYTSNGIDAQKLNGVTSPIEVHLPTIMDPTFKVRDFGPGLDLDDTKKLILGYGASADIKRESNEMIGGFGIGCKCAFSLCDSFTYRIWHEGRLRVWSCFLDDRDAGKAQLLTDIESAERSGVEVSIPIDSTDRVAFAAALTTTFKYWPASQRPTVVGQPTFAWVEPSIPVSTRESKVSRSDRNVEDTIRMDLSWTGDTSPRLVMGNMEFTIDVNEVRLFSSEDALHLNYEDRKFRTQTISNMVIHVPIGFVQIAPNREQLQYSSATKQILRQLIETFASTKSLAGISSELMDEKAGAFGILRAIESFGLKAPNKYERYLHRNTFVVPIDSTPRGFMCRFSKAGTDDKAKFAYTNLSTPRGSDMISSSWNIRLPPETRSVQTIIVWYTNTLPATIQRPYRKYAETASTALHAACHKGLVPSGNIIHTLVLLDTPLNRAIPWVTDGSTVVIEDADIEASGATLPECGIEHPAARTTTHSTNGGRVAAPACGRKFVSLSLDWLKEHCPYGHVRAQSSAWAPELAKGTSSGVYLGIGQFNIAWRSANMSAGPVTVRRNGWVKLFEFLKESQVLPALGGEDARILGIKKVASVKENPEFIELLDYIKATFHTNLEQGTISQAGVNTAITKGMLLRDKMAYDKYEIRKPEKRDCLYQAYELTYNIAEAPRLRGTRVQAAALKWKQACDNITIIEAQWAELFFLLADAVCGDTLGIAASTLYVEVTAPNVRVSPSIPDKPKHDSTTTRALRTVFETNPMLAKYFQWKLRDDHNMELNNKIRNVADTKFVTFDTPSMRKYTAADNVIAWMKSASTEKETTSP